MYWAIDLHGVVVLPTYSKEISTRFYPLAKEVLQKLSKRKDAVNIMYTCSDPEKAVAYQKFFAENGIRFDYINCNPEIEDKDVYGDYSIKPYFNIMLEDKAGFDPLADWRIISQELDNQKELVFEDKKESD
eukprot:CAMPEP_0174268514 /NCGR_PEP_ID=MMETSP0439-20130205/37712_1 /TAXON_ID=0 /ORGANISM="Stereomyxa ramosa, Strain Chinc5" /LENGTH=130 /DNA_ID=CAMNT_0015356727 /DNA_START=21 /DNA_END=413 /DNA_ORIENTATION=+